MTNASRFTAIFLTALTSAVAVSPALASRGQCPNSGSSNSGSTNSGGSQSNSNSGPGYPFLAR
jgi:hypothetical protein